MSKHTTRIAQVAAGWCLVVAGIAGLVLPGPGLLALFAGLAILANHYEWARRRVAPVKAAAFRSAEEGVKNWRRILLSCLGIAALAVAGVLWIVRPGAPEWWPLADRWWLPGGLPTGIALVLSALIALVLLVYSYRRFRGPSPTDGD